MINLLIRGFIDGSLSTLGIVVGASAASSQIVIAAAVGGTLANGLSNFLGAFAAAGGEEYEELRAIERAMVARDLKKSARYRQARDRSIRAGAFDALATVAGGTVPIIPYMLAPASRALFISSGLVAGSVLVVGLYLGRLSRQNLLLSGLRMAVFAVAIAVGVYFIQELIVPAD